MSRPLALLATIGGPFLWGLFWLSFFAGAVRAADPDVGVASWYGPGDGVATQWCTWTLRHTAGCGLLAVQSLDTGVTVVAPVIDWCQCYRGTAAERLVDLQWGVVAALGLDRAAGLYPVRTWRVDGNGSAVTSPLPNTALGGTP